jgi:hypothetical protein
MVEKPQNTSGIKDSSPYPFPERASEFWEKVTLQEEIQLTDKERGFMEKFDLSLYEEFDAIKPVTEEVSVHTIYPEAFVSREGLRAMSFVYENSDMWKDYSKATKDWSKKKERVVGDAIFSDLLAIVSDDEKYQALISKSIEYENLSALAGEDYSIISSILNSHNITNEREEGDLSINGVSELFYSADMAVIPKQIRKRTSTFSIDYSRGKFLDSFVNEFSNEDQEILKVDNPIRISKVSNPQKLAEELELLRIFKGKLREIASQIHTKEMSAEVMDKLDMDDVDLPTDELLEVFDKIIELYRIRVNIQLARRHEYGPIIFNNPKRSKEESKALELLKPGLGEDKMVRSYKERPSRMLQRIDRYLEGVGMVTVDGRIRYHSINNELEIRAKQRSNESIVKEDKETDSNVRIDAETLKDLTQLVLDYLEMSTWEAEVSKTAKSMRTSPHLQDGDRILIPHTINKTPLTAAKSISSELAHALRVEMKRKIFAKHFQLYTRYSAGRIGSLSEGADKYFNRVIMDRLTGSKDRGAAYPYYYAVIKAKEKGGTFRDGFLANIKARATREGQTTNVWLGNKKKEDLRKIYNATLRVWRRHTPLSDTSGKITNSAQLRYIEGELIAEKIADTKLWPLLFISGVDLYTIENLTAIGAVDLSQIEKPNLDFVDVILKPFVDDTNKTKDPQKVLGNIRKSLHTKTTP